MDTMTRPRTISASSLINEPVHNLQDERIGKIEDYMIDLQGGCVEYAVLSFGGFLGFGGKMFAIPWNSMQLDTDRHAWILDVSEDRLKQAPGFDKDNWPDLSNTDYRNSISSFWAANTQAGYQGLHGPEGSGGQGGGYGQGGMGQGGMGQGGMGQGGMGQGGGMGQSGQGGMSGQSTSYGRSDVGDQSTGYRESDIGDQSGRYSQGDVSGQGGSYGQGDMSDQGMSGQGSMGQRNPGMSQDVQNEPGLQGGRVRMDDEDETSDTPDMGRSDYDDRGRGSNGI